jgi:hypothetical protein
MAITREDYFASDFVEDDYALTLSGGIVNRFDVSNKRIYLEGNNIVDGSMSYHPTDDIYPEMRAFRRLDTTLRVLDTFLEAQGNVFKGVDDVGAAHYTGRLTIFKHGWRVVPYNTDHTLNVTGEQITDDGQSGAAIMDTTESTSNVIINYAPPTTEIIRDEKALLSIERMSFDSKVTLDAINGVNLADNDLAGNSQFPVKTADEAVLIGALRGLSTICIIGDYTFSDTDVLDNYTIRGENAGKTKIFVPTLTDCIGCSFEAVYVTGTLDGGSILRDCIIDDLDYVNGVIWQCMLNPGTIILGGNTSAHFLDCYSGQPGSGTSYIDMGGSGNSLGIRGYNGGIGIKNKTGPESVSIDLNSGQIKLDADVTQGEIVCRGVGKITDNTIPQVGLDVQNADLLNSHNIANATLNTDLTNFSDIGTLGEASRQVYYNGFIAVDSVNGVAGTDYPTGTRNTPVNNIADAFALSVKNNIYKFGLSSDTYTFSATDSLRGYFIFSQSGAKTVVNIGTGCNTESAFFESVNLTGTMDGRCVLTNCLIGDLANFEGHASQCGFDGSVNITLGTNNDVATLFQDCQNMGSISEYPTINYLNVGTKDATFRNYAGTIKIIGKVANQFTSVLFDQGAIMVDNTCIAGIINVSGNGQIIQDDSNGTEVLFANLFNPSTFSTAVWDAPLTDHLEIGSSGLTMAYSKFLQSGVCVGTDGVSGTNFPIGTHKHPVNNIIDAKVIAENFGLNRINLHSDITIPTGQDISNLILISQDSNTVTLEPGCITNHTTYENAIVVGQQNGYSTYRTSFVGSAGLTNFEGIMYDTTFDGDVAVSTDNTKHAIFVSCFSGIVPGPTTIDCGGDGAKIAIRGLTGALLFTNKTGTTQAMFIDCYSARVGFDSTVTAGDIHLRGIGYIYQDDSTGVVLNTEGFVSRSSITQAVWDADVNLFTRSATTGYAQKTIMYLPTSVHIDTELVTNGDGSQAFPFNVLNDALDFAEENNIYSITVYKEVVIDRPLTNWVVNGVGLPVIEFDGANVDRSQFYNCELRGISTGSIRADNCTLAGGFNLNGGFLRCGIKGDLLCAIGSVNNLIDCFDMLAGLARPTISMNPLNQSTLTLRGYAGGLTISDCDTINDILTIGVTQGSLTFDASCSAGTMVARGSVILVDETTGATVLDQTITPSTITDTVWADSNAVTLQDNVSLIKNIETGRWKLEKATNQMIFYADDNSTEVARFNLYDENGQPSLTDVFQRVKV